MIVSYYKGFPFSCSLLQKNNEVAKMQSNEQLVVLVGSPLFYLSEGMHSHKVEVYLWILSDINQSFLLQHFFSMFYTISRIPYHVYHITLPLKMDGWAEYTRRVCSIEIYAWSVLSTYDYILNCRSASHMNVVYWIPGWSSEFWYPDCLCWHTWWLINDWFYLFNGLLLQTIDLKVSVQGYRGLVL